MKQNLRIVIASIRASSFVIRHFFIRISSFSPVDPSCLLAERELGGRRQMVRGADPTRLPALLLCRVEVIQQIVNQVHLPDAADCAHAGPVPQHRVFPADRADPFHGDA